MKFCKNNLFYLNSNQKLTIDFPIKSPSLAFIKLKYLIKENKSFEIINPDLEYTYLINPENKLIEIKKKIQMKCGFLI